ncbi:Palmitoyltransferase [Linnemannia zychae]|nr:Palmitoyltransferase [Linnemannia zychae]
MSGNDKWIALLAWILFFFITISSQVFVFWPWLFGSWLTSSASHNAFVPMDPNEALEPLENGVVVGGFVETSLHESGSSSGLTFGYLSVMWANLNVRALLYLVPFNCSLIMLGWTYYLTMTTEPGSPPHDWIKCPYHLGVLANFQAVLGDNPLLWLWPQPMLGDGLQFKMKKDIDVVGRSEEEFESPLLFSSSKLSPSETTAAGVSQSSSRSPMSKRWFGPTEVRQSRSDELVEMV